MKQYTRGPWMGFNNGFKIWVKQEDNLKQVGQFVADLSEQADKEKAWADAHLIAAAPQLLESVHNLLRIVSFECPQYEAEIRIAFTAIDKAEGRKS